MNSQIAEPFCPIYCEAREAAPWKHASSAHAGLLFDKFADAWRNAQGGQPGEQRLLEFDKGVGRNNEGANQWINAFHKRKVGCAEALSEACSRQQALVETLGGRVIFLKNTDRFVTGMGREHPLENGFAWHHTLGVPYLPGSSLKGMLRSWLREEYGDIGKDKHGDDAWDEPESLQKQFGTQGQAGCIILLDMLPTSPPELCVDVMTPHYGDYYQKGEIPGDWQSPVPISFLTVEKEQSWQLGIIPAYGDRSLDDKTVKELVDELLEAFEICGAGAKTAVGYGRFRNDADAEAKFIREQEERRRSELEKTARQASMAGASEPLQALITLQWEQNWKKEASDQRMMEALKKFAEDHPAPPADCLEWIRELLESMPNYHGVWDHPDEKRGKKKDKWKYQSAAVRELVKTLNPRASQDCNKR